MHTLYDSPDIEELTINEQEAWKLSDLMKLFYTLKDTAEIFHQGNSNCASDSVVNLKDEKLEQHINEILLPKIFSGIYQILTPA